MAGLYVGQCSLTDQQARQKASRPNRGGVCIAEKSKAWLKNPNTISLTYITKVSFDGTYGDFTSWTTTWLSQLQPNVKVG